MKKKTIDLVIKGEVDVNGVTIKHIEGGFGENQKCLTCKDIAEVHEVEVKRINELINNNLDEFEEGIDILDLTKDENSKVVATDLGLITSNGQKHCYLLSEQGYFALNCLMKTDKAKEIRKQLRRNYFRLKEENKKLRKYGRSNNRFTTKCLMNLEGKRDKTSEYLYLVNNAVRNEVERAIEQIGIKAGFIAENSRINENKLSEWRCRRNNLDHKELENIVNLLSKFKEFLD